MKKRLLFAALVIALGFAGNAAAQKRDVDLKNRDATPLKGTYFPAGKPGPGVVLLHMCNSNRKVWENLAGMLNARGIHVMTVDYRGFGESGGTRWNDLPPNQRQGVAEGQFPGDVEAAFEYLVSQPGVDRDRIGAAGGSCGVNQAVQLARRKREVKTLVLLAGGANQFGTDFLTNASWLPIMSVAARDDGNAVENMRWIVGFSSNPANVFKEYDKGGHGTDLFPVHKELEPAIADWFEKYLVKSPPTPSLNPGEPGPSAKISAQINEGGAAKILEMVREAKKAGRTMIVPPENAINAVGYQQLQGGQVQAAIQTFALNVEAYPDSANCYDSLSDAYLQAGDRAKALEYARKALEALPRDRTAPDAFKEQIRQGAEAKIKQLSGSGSAPKN